jgi:hypothetical protein
MPKIRLQRGAQSPSHWEDGCLSLFALTKPQHLCIEVDAVDFQVRHVRCPQPQFTDAEDDCIIASAKWSLKVCRSEQPIDFVLPKRRWQ